MPRKKTVKRKPKTRARYTGAPSKASKVREIFKDLPAETLQDRGALEALLRKARIKITNSDIYRIRNEFLRGPSTAASANGAHGGDLIKDLMVVKKSAEQVGGLARLKELVSMIERIRQ